MLAEQFTDIATLKEMMGKKLLRPGSRRNAVNRAMNTKGYNQRRAFALARIDPRVYRRTSKRPADKKLRARMKQLASEWRRFGHLRQDSF